MDAKKFLKRWRFTLILIAAVTCGDLLGYLVGPKASVLKPFGEVFLNLLFTAVVPLIFFSLSSAVAASSNLRRLSRIGGLMLVVFLITGIIASCLMLFAVKIFDPADGLTLSLAEPAVQQSDSFAEKIVNTITVNDFSNLLNRRNILALIIFSIMTVLPHKLPVTGGGHFGNFWLAAQR